MSYSPHWIDYGFFRPTISMEWERKFEPADLEKHKFLQEAKLLVCDSPLEATAWENGFVLEAKGPI